MTSSSRWRSGARAAARFYPAFVVMLLAAMLVLPTATALGGPAALPAGATASLAQATPADAQPAETLPAETLPAETLPAETLPAETRLLPEDQSGIFLNKFECSGPFGGDHQALLENCTVVSDVDFDIFGPNLQLAATGGISLERLPAGLYRIREYLPVGYGDPYAFCGIGSTTQLPAAYSRVIVYDGYYEFELGPSQAIFCDWFNISAQAAADSATISINKHFCRPPAVFDAYSATIYELAPNCQEPPFPVPFSVTKDGVRIDGGTANGAPDLLTFSGLPVGDVTIIEEMPEGYGDPLVYCSVKDEFGAARAPLAQATVDNDRAFWRLNAGDVVFCDWFNIPSPLGTTISVVKVNCPDAIAYDLLSAEDYAAACNQPAADVSFKLDGARTGNPGEQLTDATGQVTWSEMEADRYYLTEEVPPGFGLPVVFCSYYDPAAMQSRDYRRYAVSSENRIELDVADGQAIICIWFNISSDWAGSAPAATPDTATTPGDLTAAPETTPSSGDPIASPEPATAASTSPGITPATESPDPATTATVLVIVAHRCVPGADSRDAADPGPDCVDQIDDITFELVATGGPDDRSRRRPDIGGGSGAATFSGVAAGDYRLVPVNLAAGSTTFVQTCASTQRDFSEYPFVPFASGAADGSFRLSLVANEALACNWYEVPGAES